MRSSVWITDTTVNERIEHQQSCYGQEADHDNNLPRSLIRFEVEHFKAYSFGRDGASGRCRRRCAGTTDVHGSGRTRVCVQSGTVVPFDG